jgi:hypothetical protein
MHPTPRHIAAEARFRELLAQAALPSPDRVEHDREAVVFLWEGPRVAVCVDLDGPPPDATAVSATLEGDW